MQLVHNDRLVLEVTDREDPPIGPIPLVDRCNIIDALARREM